MGIHGIITQLKQNNNKKSNQTQISKLYKLKRQTYGYTRFNVNNNYEACFLSSVQIKNLIQH